jgi:hypothetical protein
MTGKGKELADEMKRAMSDIMNRGKKPEKTSS